jgi:hypothetical protein
VRAASRVWAFTWASLAAFCLPARASAGLEPALPFEIFARGGVTWAGAKSPVDIRFHDVGCPRGYGLGPFVEGGVGLRLVPRWLGIGVLGGWRSTSSSDASCALASPPDQSRSALWVGPYGRVRVSIGAVDAVATAGLVYMREGQTWDASFSAAGRIPTTLVHHGLAAPLSGSLLIRLGRVVALGPFVEVTPVLPLGSSFADGADTTARPYFALAGGLELRISPFR